MPTLRSITNDYWWYGFSALIGVIIVIFAINLPSFARRGAFLLPAITLLAYYSLKKICHDRFTLQILFSLFVILLVIGLFGVTYGYIVTPPDALFYHQEGLEISRELQQKGISAFEIFGDPSVRIYTWFLGIFYLVFGEAYLAIQAITALFMTLSVALANRTFRVLYDRALPPPALLLLIVFPAIYWRGATPLRGPIATFFVLLAIYIGTKWLYGKEGGLIKEGWLLLITVGGVFATRYQNVVLVGIFLGFALVPRLIRILSPFFIMNAKKLGIIILITLIIILGFYGTRTILRQYSLGSIENITGRYAKRGVSQFGAREISSVKELFVKPVTGLWGLKYLLIPYPWQYNFSFDADILYPTLNSIYTWLTVLLAGCGFFYSIKRHRYFSLLLLLFLILSFTTYSIIDTHRLGIIRHRLQFIPLLYLYIGPLFLIESRESTER